MSALTEISPRVEQLLEHSISRRGQRLLQREQVVHAGFAVLFLAAYAVVARAEFPSGAGYALPTQVVFVPMLLLLSTPTVPLLIAVGLILSSCLPGRHEALSPERVLLAAGDASYALAPVLVLVLGGAQT